MKLKSYNILFRLLSFLSDKSGGARVFVKYKLLLGTFILGVSSISAQSAKTKDDEKTIKNPVSRPTCYVQVRVYPEEKKNFSKINGIVRDSYNQPLAGVSIELKGSDLQTTSNLDGEFELESKINDIFVFSHLGYLTQEYKITDVSKFINITLKNHDVNLSCYIVVVKPEK